LVLWLGWHFGSGLIQGQRQADVTVQHFHDQLNAGQYEEIYGEGTDELRGEDYKHGEFLKILSAVHAKLGNVESSSLQNISLTTNLNGTFLVTVNKTTFEKGEATETFTWRKEDGGLKLNGYNIQSNALVLN
jgi:hypothetical protein